MRAFTDPAPILAFQQGRSDTAFARFLGIDRQTLYRWRRGQVAKISSAERIAERLGVHVDELWPEVDTEDPTWWTRAACDGMDRNLFFTKDTAAEAKAVCRSCPVRPTCLEWVLVNVRSGDDFGIWGGTSARERRSMRQVRQRMAS